MSKKMTKYQQYKAHNRVMLENIIKSYLQFDNLPDSIDGRYVKYGLCNNKDLAAFMYKGEPVVSLGAASGLDLYYRPTTFSVANPYILIDKPLKIGTECAVAYLTENYTKPFTFNELINIYAGRLADIDISIDTSVRNSRVCNIMLVDDDKEAIRTGQILDEIYNDGSAAVMSFNTSFNRDANAIYPIKARDNIVTSELADARRNVLADFYAYLGINTIAVDKKERTNLAEMSSNTQQLDINAGIWEDAIHKWLDDTNRICGTNITFSLRRGEVETDVEATIGTEQTGDN